MSDFIYYDFDEFQKLLAETTENLKNLNKMQKHMQWQFDTEDFTILNSMKAPKL